MPEPRLVYVDEPWAYFATEPESAWGDDWNDAPHHCNAGEPYLDRGGEITKVAYDGDLEIVGTVRKGLGFGVGAGRWGHLSVEQINNGEAPWLVQFRYGERTDDGLIAIGVQVPALVSLEAFVVMVNEVGGRVYFTPSKTQKGGTDA